MKGNRGLEALAALCGDESKAVAAAERSSEASTNSSDRNQNNKSTDNETIAGVPGTMTSTFGAGTQQPNPTNAFTNVDMNTSNLLGQLTPQQLLTAAASVRPGGMIDPKVSQSLLLSAGMAANQQQQNPAHVLQQYVQAQAAQQQQAAQAAIYQQVTAAATAMLQSNPQAALLATMASLAQAGNNGNSNIEPKPQASLPGVGIQSRIGASTNNSKETKAPAPSTSTGAVISSSNSIGKATKSKTTSSSISPSLKLAKGKKDLTVPVAQQSSKFGLGSVQQQYGLSSSNQIPSNSAFMQVGAGSGASAFGVDRSKITNPATSSSSTADLDDNDKKQQKRAANRRSAQLSRKRKKQFIELLKQENDELRRKEQILKAIPDLVVVFDSSGKLSFVSESVCRFLDVSAVELVGSSFWGMICEESVRQLKSAFMDSLAARDPNSETATLGPGVWELRLKYKDSQLMTVTLNGVVHFKGEAEAPEVVCCIRPLSGQQKQQPSRQPAQKQQHEISTKLKVEELSTKKQAIADDSNIKHSAFANTKSTNRTVSCSDGDASRISDESNGTNRQERISVGHHDASRKAQDTVETEQRNMKYSRTFHQEKDEANNDSDDNNMVDGGEVDGTNNSIRISDGDSSDGLESVVRPTHV